MKYIFDETINIPLNGNQLTGELIIPEKSESIVLFSHGSGSSRLSPRNIHVAKILQQKGIATFLFDLLTVKEDHEYEMRFNIELLTDRLIYVTKYITQLEWMRN